MLLSHSVFHYMLERMSDVSVCWCYSWPSFLTEPLENDIQEVAVHSLPQNSRADIEEQNFMTGFSHSIPVFHYFTTPECIYLHFAL